ncbi:MAG: bi-domain-containing oxidoreductase [Anaerolineaceae bacterium]|nr:bi-domain-containing oxidoreductase [Anaerolineaceae bacterium]
MKQLLQDMKSGQTTITEVPVPKPADNAALVRTAASLVSVGTERMLVEFAQQSLVGKVKSRPDLAKQVLEKAKREGLITTIEAAMNRLDQPMALGYSSSGTIVEVGSELQGFKVGDRVACAGGGYAVHAEYVAVPQNLLVKLPDDVDFESAAFATIGAVALQGFRLASPQVGEHIAIIGLGLLGLLSVAIAQAAGCSVLGIDLDPNRIELARQMGATAVLRKNAEEAAQSFSRGQGMDAILICADTKSDDPVTLAGEIARDKAKVVAVGAVGLNIPRKLYYEKELDFVVSRSYGPGRYDKGYEENGIDYPIGYVRWTEARNMQAFLDLLASKKINTLDLITHRYPIEEAPKAYQMITAKEKEPFLAVLLTYSSTEQKQVDQISNPNASIVRLRPGDIIALGVLGAGNYARTTFLPAVKKVGGVAPVGIISASGLSAQHAAQRFGFGFSGSDPKSVFTDPAINLVAILTRHHLHSSQILEALKRKKHVFCEKPLAINQSQLDKIAKVLGKEDTPMLTVGYNRRFAPLAKQLKAFLDGHSEPMIINYRINAGFLPLDHWTQDAKLGGGRIIGEGCHFIDFLTYLVGKNPSKVSAVGLSNNGKYNNDNIILTFTYPDGSIGAITYVANGDKAYPKERVEVFCGGRVAVLNDFRSLELANKGKITRKKTAHKQDKGHQAAWSAFLTALRNLGEPPIPYDQLIATTQASFAAVEALKKGVSIEIVPPTS